MIHNPQVSFAHSPDCDDAFMFYGIASGAIDTGGVAVTQIMKDIQTLNEEAKEGKYEVTAISFAAYPEIKDQYLLMPCGASFGLQCGPIVLGHESMSTESLSSVTVAIPGHMTTAYLLLRLYIPNVKVVMLPFQEIIPAIQSGQVQAGLIIHEGQLSYIDSGLKKLLDLASGGIKKPNYHCPLAVMLSSVI